MRTKIQTLIMAMIALTFVLWTGNTSFAYEEEVTPGEDKSSSSPLAKISGRVQTIWETSLHKTNGSGTNADQLNKGGSQFYLSSIRLKADVKLHERVKARVYFSRDSKDGANADIKEAWIKFKIHEGFNVELGRFIYGFHREIFSGGSLLFVSGADSVSRSGVGNRDTGLQLFGKLLDRKIYYMLALTNGSRDLRPSAIGGNNHYQFTGRLQLDPFGEWKHGKEWLTGGNATFKLSTGVAVVYRKSNEPNPVTDPNTDPENEFGISGDLLISWTRLYFQGQITYLTAESGSGNTTAGQTLEPYLGFNLDVAFKIIPKLWLINVRLDHFNGDDVSSSARYPSVLDSATTKSQTTQIVIGFNIFPFMMGHKLKIQPQVIFDLKRKANDVNKVKRAIIQVGTMINF